MQEPSIILDILKTRSSKNYEIKDIYHYLYNEKFYIKAYKNLINTEKEIITKELKRIHSIIEEMKFERYVWKKTIDPKETYGGMSNLLVPEWQDKLVQEVLRMILSAIYEPKFSDASHGFRPNRGCHTALARVYQKGQASEFFIKHDIINCFESIDHTILLNILKRDIKDGRFIELIRKMLKAGKFGNDFVYGKTYSGTPQGGVLSPLLANIYLNEFDQWVENTLVPKWNVGKNRPASREYHTLVNRIYNKNKLYNSTKDESLKQELKTLRKKLRSISAKKSIEEYDYRRFAYTRYADDFLITFTGTFDEVNIIDKEIKEYLTNVLKFDINEDERPILKADKYPVRFLGYNILVQKSNTRIKHGQRSITGQIGFFVPDDVIRDKIRKYSKNGKPIHLPYRMNDPEIDIIRTYQSELRGIAQYYKFARNQYALTKLKYVMEVSLVKTLANKLKIHCTKVYKKFKSTQVVNGCTYKVLKATVINGTKIYSSYFGGVPLRRKTTFVKESIDDNIINTNNTKSRSSLSTRLLNNVCELCGSTKDIEMHHIRALKDIRKNKSLWAKKLSAMNRKTIAVCKECHNKIHNGTYDGRKLS